MITLRPAEERGHAEYDWLNTFHTFSFNTYHDPDHMGYRALRVINDDRVAPASGFPTHPHRDMEIVTYMLEGALAHKDSMGTGSTIRAGEVQYMSAGTGVLHSEFNPSPDEAAHFLQIWLLPKAKGLRPKYGQADIPAEAKRGRLALVASGDGRDGSIHMEQDAELYASVLAAGDAVKHELRPGRHAWLQVARGLVELNGRKLKDGDGAAVEEEPDLNIVGVSEAEILLFDLA
jgi:hypothetical protein